MVIPIARAFAFYAHLLWGFISFSFPQKLHLKYQSFLFFIVVVNNDYHE